MIEIILSIIGIFLIIAIGIIIGGIGVLSFISKRRTFL